MNDKAINANLVESGFYAFDGIDSRNIFYFVLLLNKMIDKAIFTESLFQVSLRFQKLRSIFVKGIVNDKWIPINNFSRKDLAIEFYETKEDDSRSFERNIMNLFNEQSKFEIDVSKEYPMKLFFYINKRINKCAMLCSFHHAFTDGKGAVQLIKCIFETYSHLINKEKIPFIKNYYSLKKITKDLKSKYQIQKDLYKSHSPNEVLPVFDNIFNKYTNQNIESYCNYNEIVIQREKFQKIKAWTKEKGMTINDFIMYVVLVFTQKYNKKLSRSSDYIGCSFTVDTRKYFEQRPLMVGNYSGYENFIINSGIIENKMYESFCEELKKFKSSKLFGLNFILTMKLFDIVPKSISRPFIYKFMKKGADDRIKKRKAISISNIGDLTGCFGVNNDIIDKVVFISGISGKLIPQLSVSSYNGVMILNMIKLNDYNGFTKEICENIEQCIDEIINC